MDLQKVLSEGQKREEEKDPLRRGAFTRHTVFVTCKAGRHRSLNLALHMREVMITLGACAKIWYPDVGLNYRIGVTWQAPKHNSRFCTCSDCNKGGWIMYSMECWRCVETWNSLTADLMGTEFNWSQDPEHAEHSESLLCSMCLGSCVVITEEEC